MARLSLTTLAAIATLSLAVPASAASSPKTRIHNIEVYGSGGGYAVKLTGVNGLFYNGWYSCPRRSTQVYEALMSAHLRSRPVTIVYNNNGANNRKCIDRAVIW